MSKRTSCYVVVEGQCAGPLVCPLSQVKAGAVVCVKQLSSSPEVRTRLREMGFCEDQKVKLLSRHPSIICQVCNARLGLSTRLAEEILVETVPAQMEAA